MLPPAADLIGTVAAANRVLGTTVNGVPPLSVIAGVPVSSATAFGQPHDVAAWVAVNSPALARAVAAAGEHGEHEAAWRLNAHLSGLFAQYNVFDAWSQAASAGLSAARVCGSPIGVAFAEESLGKLAKQRGDQQDIALQHLQSAADAFDDVGDQAGHSRAVNAAGLLYVSRDLPESALESAQAALSVAERAEAPWETIFATGTLAVAFRKTGRAEDAVPLLETVATFYQRHGAAHYTAWAIHELAAAHLAVGHRVTASTLAQTAVDLARRSGSGVFIGAALLQQSSVETACGRPDAAIAAASEAALIHQQIGDRRREAEALDLAADNHLRVGEQQRRAANQLMAREPDVDTTAD